MNTQQYGIVTLLRSALTGESLPLPEGFDLEAAYPEMVRHQIQSACYVGAVQCGADRKLPAMERLFESYARCLIHSRRQMNMAEQICRVFDGAGIDYMLLKGWNLQELYPKPELRLMGDVDILIRMEQYGAIRGLLPGLGLREDVESDHEYNWVSSALHLELHKRLIPSYNKDYYRYFGDGWQLARLWEGTRYVMSREDEFIYLLVHFAKHYRDGGIGCRHAADLWLFRRAYPLDEDYLARQLEKLRLLEFYQNVGRLLAVWFEEAAPDHKTRLMTDFIFASGAWGTAENHDISEGVRNAAISGSLRGGRLRQLVLTVFPPASALQQRYPVLKKHPALLPAVWPARWVTALLFRRDNIRDRRRALAAASAEHVVSHRQALADVGLDFHFKED